MDDEIIWDPKEPPANVPYGSIEDARNYYVRERKQLAFMQQRKVFEERSVRRFEELDAILSESRRAMEKESRLRTATISQIAFRHLADSTGKRKEWEKPPKGVIFPNKPLPAGAGRYVTVATDRPAQMGMLRIAHGKPRLPGWLKDLPDYDIYDISVMKDLLSNNKEISSISAPLHKILVEMGVHMTRLELIKKLKQVPLSTDQAFPLFMWYMAKYVGSEAITKAKETRSKTRIEVRRTDLFKSGLKQEGKKRYTDLEKTFYSGLFHFEMYRTIEKLEKLYHEREVPIDEAYRQKIKQRRVPKDIGFKKFKSAVWDESEPIDYKVRSPYLSSLPFTMARFNITRPSPDEKGRRRTLTYSEPIHMMIHPGNKANKPIKVVENQVKLKRALAQLAAQGHVLAQLPDVYQTIQMSDNMVFLLEAMNMRLPKLRIPRTVHPNNEQLWIEKETKRLYNPYRMPRDINKSCFTVKYADAKKMRNETLQLHRNHWGRIIEAQREFRRQAWRRMTTETIPVWRLRDNFIYAFCTYIPYDPYLPGLWEYPSMPW